MPLKKFSLILLALLMLSLTNLWAQKQKIIVDCDLAGDIDDAFALGLLLSSPEFDIQGFIMANGQTDKRAQVACKLLYQIGRKDIPVVIGRQTPMVVGKDTGAAIYNDQFYWAEGFTKLKPVKTSASDFIIENLKKYPHEVIIFTLAPLTNLADVMKKDPEALRLSKHIYSMMGSYFMGYDGSLRPDAEWNVYADVGSAKLFTSAGLPITYAGLEVTTTTRMDKEMLCRLFQRQSPLTNAISSLYSLWGTDKATMFDVVAVAMAIWPDLFTFRPAKIKITDDGHSIIEENQKPDCQVAMSIKTDEFFKRIMERYLRQTLGENGPNQDQDLQD